MMDFFEHLSGERCEVFSYRIESFLEVSGSCSGMKVLEVQEEFPGDKFRGPEILNFQVLLGSRKTKKIRKRAESPFPIVPLQSPDNQKIQPQKLIARLPNFIQVDSTCSCGFPCIH